MAIRHAHPLLVLLFSATAAHAQPATLAEAFGRGVPGAGAVARGTDLARVDLPAARYPDARCADDSTPVLYVRAATAAANRHDWVVFLQGGGSCNSGDECHDRWLGRDGNFGANKLSTRFAPPGGIATGGMGGRDTRNPFAAWNHVFVYYCSSDGWSGRARDVVLQANHRGRPTDYRIHFLGAQIVDAVFDLLRGGAGPVVYRDPSGARRELPDIDDASTVVFAGSSAGGNGVRANADRIGALLHAQRPGCPGAMCPLRYAAVVDASYGLATEDLDHAGTLACGTDAPKDCTYERSMRQRWEETQLGLRQGIADASCVAYHEPLGDAWRCADDVHVIEHHLSTPVFVRADLQDRLVMGNAIEAGFGYRGVPLDRALYGALQEIQLRELPQAAIDREEARSPGPIPQAASFGPQCGAHETLQHDGPTFNHAVQAADGTPLTTLDVLAAWLSGQPTGAVVQSFDPTGQPAACGPR